MGDYSEDCMDTSEDRDSFVKCMLADGFTDGCSGCVADYIDCGMDTCDEEGEDCDDCMEQKCEPALNTCAGFEPESLGRLAYAPQAKDMCMNDQDMPKLDDLDGFVDKCMQTSEDEDSFKKCMMADGFTAGCVGCVADFVGCVMDKCDSECAEEGDACDYCMDEKCEPAFDTCSGMTRFTRALGRLAYQQV